MRVNTFIIGASKAGTTNLASWLSLHPSCCVSSPKETIFFASDRLYDRGIDWYHKTFFQSHSDESVLCDATPSYSDRDEHPDTAERVSRYNDQAKIIYMVRHPKARVESAWKMYAANQPNYEDEALNRTIRTASKGFASFVTEPLQMERQISTSRFLYQMEPWESHFPPEQIHLVFLEDLKTNETVEITRLAKFLGISPEGFAGRSEQIANSVSSRRSPTAIRKTMATLKISKLLRTVLPSRVVKRLCESRIGEQPTQVGEASWPEDAARHFESRLKSETQDFLLRHGKSSDYYAF